jgi:choline dehydrogenase
VKEPTTLNDAVANPLRKLREGLRYVFQRKGFLTMGSSQAAGFFKSNPDLASPDIQLGITLFSTDKAGDPLHPFPGISIIVRLLRPESRGEVMIASSDPFAPPKIRPNYLAAASDLSGLVTGMIEARRVMKAEPMRRHIVEEHDPGPSVATSDDMADFLIRRGGISFHPVGTCRMGQDDRAVVDERLRLRGIAGLRVIDASVMPTIVSGNTNAPAIMIGEKGAAMILEDTVGG